MKGGLAGIKDSNNRAIADRILANLMNINHTCEHFLTAGDDTGALVGAGHSPAKKRTGSDFYVTAGLSNLNFEAIFSHPTYGGAFYGAMKTLHFIELTTPSDNDLETLKNIVLSSVPEEQRAQLQSVLEAIAKATKSLREESAEFYTGIEAILKFIEEFKQIKTKYNTESGEEALDFYGNIDSFAAEEAAAEGVGVVGTGVEAEAPLAEFVPGPDSVERYYTEIEINILGEPFASIYKRDKGTKSKTPDKLRSILKMQNCPAHLLPIRYKGDPGDTESEAETVGAPHAPIIVPKIYGNDVALRSWLTKDNRALNAELNPTSKGSQKVEDKVSKHYGPYAEAQIEYFKRVDFTKIGEEDVLHFARQLMSCIDLYLRIRINERISQIIEAAPGPEKAALRDLRTVFENTYMLHSAYTIPTIVKAYTSPSGLNDEMTNLMTKMLKYQSYLREMITNMVVNIFERIDLTDRDANVIIPILTAIDDYLTTRTSLSDVIILRK